MPWSRAKLRTEDTAISVVILMQQTAYYIDGLLKVRRVLLGSQHVHEVRHRQAKGWLLGQDSNLESVSRRIYSRFQFAVESTPGPGYFSVPVHGALPQIGRASCRERVDALVAGEASYGGHRDIRGHFDAADGILHRRVTEGQTCAVGISACTRSTTSASKGLAPRPGLEPGIRQPTD